MCAIKDIGSLYSKSNILMWCTGKKMVDLKWDFEMVGIVESEILASAISQGMLRRHL